MKVLFISEYYPPFSQGGGERSAKKLVEAISRNGAETELITSKRKFKVTDWRRFFYFPIYSIYKCLQMNAHKFKCDVVHCLNSTSIYTILIKPIIRKPFVIHINSYVLLCPKGTLVYKDQSVRRECKVNCSLKTCIGCCKESKWVGVKEMDISKLVTILLWIRYKLHTFLLQYYNKIIPISKQTERVLLRKGFKPEKIEQIYYGLDY